MGCTEDELKLLREELTALRAIVESLAVATLGLAQLSAPKGIFTESPQQGGAADEEAKGPR